MGGVKREERGEREAKGSQGEEIGAEDSREGLREMYKNP